MSGLPFRAISRQIELFSNIQLRRLTSSILQGFRGELYSGVSQIFMPEPEFPKDGILWRGYADTMEFNGGRKIWFLMAAQREPL